MVFTKKNKVIVAFVMIIFGIIVYFVYKRVTNSVIPLYWPPNNDDPPVSVTSKYNKMCGVNVNFTKFLDTFRDINDQECENKCNKNDRCNSYNSVNSSRLRRHICTLWKEKLIGQSNLKPGAEIFGENIYDEPDFIVGAKKEYTDNTWFGNNKGNNCNKPHETEDRTTVDNGYNITEGRNIHTLKPINPLFYNSTDIACKNKCTNNPECNTFSFANNKKFSYTCKHYKEKGVLQNDNNYTFPVWTGNGLKIKNFTIGEKI